jgi:hypothetical protein
VTGRLAWRSRVLNRAPVFLNAIARGGSNIVWNLLLSHPDLCVPAGETHEVWKGEPLISAPWRRRLRRIVLDRPLCLAVGQNLFATDRRDEPPLPPPWLQRAIDATLFVAKLRARHAWNNRDRDEGVRYTTGEIARARLFGKNIDGIVFLTTMFQTMYPDATFFGLVRDGLALCEAHLRRRWTARAFGARYRALAGRMADDSLRLPRHHLVRFEDVLADPQAALATLQRAAGLDPDRMGKVRLQVKPRIGADGVRRLPPGTTDRQVVWYPHGSFQRHIEGEINEHQLRRLSPSDRREFLAEAAPTMARLGY